MPSSPKIKKEEMLQAALEIVIERGYSSLNIKAVAQKLGCSTAPISWQFGGMDGLRGELISFAEQYVRKDNRDSCMREISAFEQRGMSTIELALEKPNLFRFLYMGEGNQLLSSGFQLTADDNGVVYQKMADDLGISLDKVLEFTMLMLIYTQGIGSLIVSGIVTDTKENMFQMLHKTGVTYLKGLGVEEGILQSLSGNDWRRNDE
jgi:AcrR family transcriptional regulator